MDLNYSIVGGHKFRGKYWPDTVRYEPTSVSAVTHHVAEGAPHEMPCLLGGGCGGEDPTNVGWDECWELRAQAGYDTSPFCQQPSEMVTGGSWKMWYHGSANENEWGVNSTDILGLHHDCVRDSLKALDKLGRNECFIAVPQVMLRRVHDNAPFPDWWEPYTQHWLFYAVDLADMEFRVCRDTSCRSIGIQNY